MTDEARLADPAPAIAALGPQSAVIFRHYGAQNRRQVGESLRRLCRSRGIPFLVAGDARLAHALGADGLHLPEYLLRCGPRRWSLWAKPGWLITAAAHSPAALEKAARAGVHAALLSPVLPTPSHPDAWSLGSLRFAAWVHRSAVPVYGLGGLDRLTGWRRIRGSGAVGWASVSNL